MNQQAEKTRAQLRPAGRRLIRAVILDHVARGLLRAGRLSALVGISFVLYQLITILKPGYQLRSIPAFVVAIVSVLVLSLLWSIAQAVRRMPTLIQVAQRLDLTTNAHNMIATSLYLQAEAQSSPFARAAVRQGRQVLSQVYEKSPMIEQRPKPWKSMLGCLLVVIAAGYGGMGLGGLTSGAGYPTTRDLPAAEQAKETSTADKALHEPEEHSNQPSPTTSRGTAQSTAQREQTRHLEAGRASDQQRQLAMGNVRSGIINPPGYAFQDSSSLGTSVEKTANNQTDDKKVSARRKDNRISPPNRNKPLKGEGGQEDSTIGQGLAGGQGGQAVNNSWTQQLNMVEANEDEEDQNAQVEDQQEMSVHRGGIQPFLKDRNQAPSRELGISSDQGKPGSGRGGPSLPKKSRGTASLVLGIAIPDFVKGRLGPGANKVTHERSAPQTNPGEPASVVETDRRNLDESVCPKYDVPYEYRYMVKAYFLALSQGDKGEGDNAEAKGP